MDATNVQSSVNAGRLRHVLTTLGGAAVAKGIITGQVETWVLGAVLVGIGVVLSEANAHATAAWARNVLAVDNAIENSPVTTAVDNYLAAKFGLLPAAQAPSARPGLPPADPGSLIPTPPPVQPPQILAMGVAAK